MQTGSIAGTPQAAQLGGALQSRARGLASAQQITNQPAGKTSDTDAVEAGDQAGDRAPDGRQPRDTFERSDGARQMTEANQETRVPSSGFATTSDEGKRVDYQA